MKKILFLLILLVSGMSSAFAEDYYWYTNYNSVHYASPDSACKYVIERGDSNSWNMFDYSVITSPTLAECYGHTRSYPNSGGVKLDSVHRGGNGCAAPNVYDSATGTCSPPKCPAAGTSASDLSITVGWKTGPDVNSPNVSNPVFPDYLHNYISGSCEVSLDIHKPVKSCFSSTTPSAKGYYRLTCDYSAIYTGNSASTSDLDPSVPTVSEPSAPSPGKNQCPNGTTSGGIDSSGVPICIGTGTPPSNSTTTTTPPTKTTNSDGSTSETSTSTRTNSDGSKTTTTTTTTTNADGSKSTSTSSTTSSSSTGTPGKADPENPQNDFCSQHPELNACRNSLVSGECEAVACTGDAIQCAILRQQAKDACEARKATDLSNLGNAIINGNDPMAGGLPNSSNGQSFLAASSLDQSGFLGASCFADKQFMVQGRAVTIPFSKVCEHLLPLRLAIMAIAAFVSIKIISKPIMG